MRSYAPTILPDGRGVFQTRTFEQYRPPEVLRTRPVPGGGQMRLEALAPLGSGPPAIRWVADFKVGRKHETIESYLQMPHQGMTQLHGTAAERAIAEDAERLIRWIARKRAQARAGTT